MSNTSGVVDPNGNIVLQHFDAFGVPLDRIALASNCPQTTCRGVCDDSNEPEVTQRPMAATGQYGYHGQEGYQTDVGDPERCCDVGISNSDPSDAGYDEDYPNGYQDRSTGFIHVGARFYEPATGRFLQVDPVALGPEIAWGQNNRWAYCANDPVNASDPSGMISWFDGIALGLAGLAIGLGGALLMALATAMDGLALIFSGLAIIFDVVANNTSDCVSSIFRKLSTSMLTLAAMAAMGIFASAWIAGPLVAEVSSALRMAALAGYAMLNVADLFVRFRE